MAASRKYDLYSNSFRADTHATFAQMREQNPILCQVGFDGKTMLIARTTLLLRLPSLRLGMPAEDLRWRPVPLFRSLASLRVAW